jgi:hypothetical protein
VISAKTTSQLQLTSISTPATRPKRKLDSTLSLYPAARAPFVVSSICGIEPGEIGASVCKHDRERSNRGELRLKCRSRESGAIDLDNPAALESPQRGDKLDRSINRPTLQHRTSRPSGRDVTRLPPETAVCAHANPNSEQRARSGASPPPLMDAEHRRRRRLRASSGGGSS